jgi:hypothetical protein
MSHPCPEDGSSPRQPRFPNLPSSASPWTRYFSHPSLKRISISINFNQQSITNKYTIASKNLILKDALNLFPTMRAG